MNTTDKNEVAGNPGVEYDPDMRLTEAVAAVMEMYGERGKRGFGKPEETDFATFSKRWGKMAENEKEQLAQKLTDFAERVAAGPDGPEEMTPLDCAVKLAEELGFTSTDAGLAVVIAGAATKKRDKDIDPNTRKYFTATRKNHDGTYFQITVPIPQYNLFEVKGILTRMSQLTLPPAPVPVSSSHP